MKKESKKRGNPKTAVMQLKSDLEWDTFKAKVLVKIEGILKPEVLLYDNYRVTFSIARLHPKPTELTGDDTYQFMINRATRSKDPAVTITVEPLVHATVSDVNFKFHTFDSHLVQSSDEKENKRNGSDSSNESESGSDAEKKKKRKKKNGKGKKKKVVPRCFNICFIHTHVQYTADRSFQPSWKPGHFTRDRAFAPKMAMQYRIVWQWPLLYSSRRKGTFSAGTYAL